MKQLIIKCDGCDGTSPGKLTQMVGDLHQMRLGMPKGWAVVTVQTYGFQGWVSQTCEPISENFDLCEKCQRDLAAFCNPKKWPRVKPVKAKKAKVTE